jgi:predicted oxidoreductase
MSGAQIRALQDRLDVPVVANQLEMSLLKRAWLESQVLVNHPGSLDYAFPHGTLEYCTGNGVTLQAYGALARGLYTGAAPEDPASAETAAAVLIRELAGTYGTTGESVLLGWLMKHPAGIAPVIGTVNPARIAACSDAARVAEAMTRADWYGLWIAARGTNLP